MGASAWVYFTPYHPKPAAALRYLREEVFAAGQYRKPSKSASHNSSPSPSQVHRQTIEQLRRSLEAGAANREEILNLISHSERLAEAAAKREPEYLRLMEALRAGTLVCCPKAQAWKALALVAFGPAPQAPVRPFRKGWSVSARIARLLMQAGESGTHSILDVTQVGKPAGHATASPLAPDLVVGGFGTTEPTRAQVEACELAFSEGLHWQAVDLAVYRDGSPAEWAFVGSSGD